MAENDTFFNFCPKAPGPTPPGIPPKRCASKFPANWSRFHPGWTKWHPINAHFSYQILTFFHHPKKHVWALWESPGGGKEIFLVSFPSSFTQWFDLKSISFPPPGDLNVLESSNRTKGWPPYFSSPEFEQKYELFHPTSLHVGPKMSSVGRQKNWMGGSQN